MTDKQQTAQACLKSLLIEVAKKLTGAPNLRPNTKQLTILAEDIYINSKIWIYLTILSQDQYQDRWVWTKTTERWEEKRGMFIRIH